MKRRNLPILLAFWIAACVSVYAHTPRTKTFTAEQAKDHVGETATVYGRVASTHYAEKTRGRATFLNLDRSYPNQIFTVVIWGRDRARFGRPEKVYRGKHVCVTGFISVYRGQPDMTLRSPRQIRAK